jgi:hypothetical protein
VLVEHVDAIGPQALQHPVDRPPDVVRAAVEPAARLPGLRVDVPAELRLDHHLVAHRLQRLADDPLGLEGPVRLGRVEQGDPLVDGGPNVLTMSSRLVTGP